MVKAVDEGTEVLKEGEMGRWEEQKDGGMDGRIEEELSSIICSL